MYDKYVIDILKKSYRGNKMGRDGSDKTIHASEIFHFCPRAYALGELNNVSFRKQTYIPFSQAVTFDIGNSLHDMVRRKLSSQNTLIGNWKCINCKTKTFGLHPKECGDCKGKSHGYIESEFVVDRNDIKIICHIDAIMLYTIKDKSFIVDVKSIGKDDYDTMLKPDLSYHYQVSSMLWILKNSKDSRVKDFGIDTEKGILLYVAKTHKNIPMKAFQVGIHPDFESLVEKDILKKLITFKKTKKLPEKTCPSRSSYLSKTCNVASLCFESKE